MEFPHTLTDGRDVTIRGEFYPREHETPDCPGAAAMFAIEDFVDHVGLVHSAWQLPDAEIDRIEKAGIAHAIKPRGSP